MSGNVGARKWMSASAMVVLGILAFSEKQAAFAQGASDRNQEVILDGISVYATKSETDSFSVPGMVSVIDRGAIDDLVANSSDDIFKGVPGVHFSGGPRRTGQVPSIRGVDGENVLILFDDARQNLVTGHDGRFLVDPDILKRVEVVRGPSSALYGSGASGGVIAFQTIDAEDLLEAGETMGVRLKSSYQSVDNERSVGITGYGITSDGKVGLVGHMTYRDADDIELGSGDTLPSNDKVKNGLLKAKVKASPSVTVTSSWLYTQLQTQDPQNAQGNNVGTPSNPLVNRLTTDSTLQSKLEYKPANNPLLDFKMVGYLSNQEIDKTEIISGRQTVREVETVGFSAQNKSKVKLSSTTNVLFTYGGELYRDEQTGTDSTSGSGSIGGVPKATADFSGVFAQAEFTIKNVALPGQLKVIPGIRYDSFSTSSDTADNIEETAFSPKLGVTYEPTKWLMLFGNYGEAFRAPSFNEAYADGVHFSLPAGGGGFVNNVFIHNPDLKPEETEGWEIGAGFKFDNVISRSDNFKIKGSYWESDATNLIDIQVSVYPGCFIPPYTGCTSQYVNVANAALSGFELEANYDSKLFYAKATYSQIDGVDKDTGDYVGVLTPNTFFVDAGFKLPAYDMRVGARATFADKFTKVNALSEERDAYSTYDLYAIWQPTTTQLKGLRVDLGIDNILDEDYEVVAAGVSEPGRNYKAAVSYKIPLCGSELCRK